MRSVRFGLFCLLLVGGLSACGDDGRRAPSRGGDGAGDGGGTGTPDGGTIGGRDAGDCTPTQEGASSATCSDGVDNDCDFQVDCADADCSGVGECPVCGEVETPLGSPLALPDGVGGSSCTSDSDCPSDQSCFEIDDILGGTTNECRESYRSTLNFTGFGNGAFESADDILSVCVVMEHSFLRDLEITLQAPNGRQVRLQRFLGQDGGEIYLGQADDCDDDDAPTPGTGATYCWTPTSSRASMLDYANGGGAMDSVTDCNGFGDVEMLPPGDYSAADDWSAFVGSSLNGEWTLLVTDLWGIDNGYIFEWSIAFDPRTVADCSVPLI